MKLEQLTEKRRKQLVEVRFDLDGVLADFAGSLSKAMGERYDDARYEREPEYRTRMWNALEQYQKDGHEFWFELEMMSDAKRLIDYVRQNVDRKFEILSATGNPKYGAIPQKHKWVARNIGKGVKVTLVRRAAQKAREAKPGRILIDDKLKAINPWKEAGGIGILHTSATNTIRQLKKMGL